MAVIATITIYVLEGTQFHKKLPFLKTGMEIVIVPAIDLLLQGTTQGTALMVAKGITKTLRLHLGCPSVTSSGVVITFAVGVQFQIGDQFWIPQPKLHGA